MDSYEKKYKEALTWMQSLYDGLHGATKKDAEHYFPELAETEDERIRKELIEFLKENHETGRADETWSLSGIERWIAWLEKQGEKKHSWGERENAYLDFTQSAIEFCYAKNNPLRKELVTWLNSFKDRCTWKPSDEQIKAVRLARSFVTDDFDENPTLSDVLVELEKQLKKLTE